MVLAALTAGEGSSGIPKRGGGNTTSNGEGQGDKGVETSEHYY